MSTEIATAHKVGWPQASWWVTSLWADEPVLCSFAFLAGENTAGPWVGSKQECANGRSNFAGLTTLFQGQVIRSSFRCEGRSYKDENRPTPYLTSLYQLERVELLCRIGKIWIVQQLTD